MGVTGFTINRAGLAAVLKSDEVRAELHRRGLAVAAVAEASAPVDTGEYKKSIHTESVITDRAVERVVADSGHAMLVEAKTRNLGRAIDAARG